VLFAQRMSAFGTRLIAYDPYVRRPRGRADRRAAGQPEDLLRESDFISIHLPKTPRRSG
jgi:D-3-phosphoglycerate dehydrogenase